MITCRLKSLIAKIEEDQGIRVTFEDLAEASNSTRQTIAKLAKNQSTRLTLGQFDQILHKLNSYGYHFEIADLLEYKK